MKEPKLKFAYKARSIVYVYKNGPRSCMKGSRTVRAYEGPDLAVAYIRDNKEIVARAVVWPKEKRYYTIYFKPQRYDYDYLRGYVYFPPDYCAIMMKALKDAGYKQRRLKGARIAKISAKKNERHYKGYVVPSVDGRRGFRIGKNYLTIL